MCRRADSGRRLMSREKSSSSSSDWLPPMLRRTGKGWEKSFSIYKLQFSVAVELPKWQAQLMESSNHLVLRTKRNTQATGVVIEFLERWTRKTDGRRESRVEEDLVIKKGHSAKGPTVTATKQTETNSIVQRRFENNLISSSPFEWIDSKLLCLNRRFLRWRSTLGLVFSKSFFVKLTSSSQIRRPGAGYPFWCFFFFLWPKTGAGQWCSRITTELRVSERVNFEEKLIVFSP